MATASSEPTTATVVEHLPEEFTAWTPPATPPADDPGPPPLVDGLPLYRLTVDQYHRMIDHEILDEKSRVTLVNGLLVAKMIKYPPHNIATDNLTWLLARALPYEWHASNQNPLLLTARQSQPEPDFKIVRGRPKDYRGRQVGAGDVAIVIEVSDSSLHFDQTTKKALYAASSIPEYWIVNLVARRVEVYNDPTGPDPTPDYRRRREFGAGAAVPLVLDGLDVVQIQVDDILPPSPDE